MPLPLDEKKRGSVVVKIMKKLRGSEGYDDMKDHNEHVMEKKMVDGAEVEASKTGLDAAAEDIIAAVESKNKESLTSALRSMIVMIMNEYD